MTDTQELLDRVRAVGVEPTRVELKTAEHGCPASVRETISAFANGEGGTILLGVDDNGRCVDIDADAVRNALVQRAADDMEPPVRGEIEVEIVDGTRRIVRFDVPEFQAHQKPCHVKTKGTYGGSYIRGGDGDRRLTAYEIDRLLENRRQPEHDRQPVPAARLDDLDQDLISPVLARMRRSRPRAFAHLDDTSMLRALGIVSGEPDEPRPTLAGLLTYGHYPQKFFPQLFISVVALPTPTMGDPGPRGERFLDNQTCEGPVPAMLLDAMAVVEKNMTRAAVISGLGRSDRYEYPLEVVRELLVNAVMHRDYSPMGCAAQIQVELYPDRLVVRSPGGFYGGVSAESMGAPGISMSRNMILAKLLTDTPLAGGHEMIAENRGSGIPTIMRTLHRQGMAPAEFSENLQRVEVTVPHHALLTDDALLWLHQLGQPGLSNTQQQALAVMRQGKSVRNATLQGWGLDSAQATRELGALVRAGLAEKHGDKSGSTYLLSPQVAPRQQLALPLDESDQQPGPKSAPADTIIELVEAHPRGEVTTTEVARALGIGNRAALNRIRRLVDAGLLEPTAATRSPRQSYRRPTHSTPTHATSLPT